MKNNSGGLDKVNSLQAEVESLHHVLDILNIEKMDTHGKLLIGERILILLNKGPDWDTVKSQD